MSRESTAIHEAAHYLVSSRLGGKDCRCELRDGGGSAHFAELADPRARLAVLTSGYVAEELHDGVAGLARQDRREAAEGLEAFPECKREALLAEAEQAAREILLAEWPLCRAIAAELRDVGHWDPAA